MRGSWPVYCGPLDLVGRPGLKAALNSFGTPHWDFGSFSLHSGYHSRPDDSCSVLTLPVASLAQVGRV
jgi:hypothetical protein